VAEFTAASYILSLSQGRWPCSFANISFREFIFLKFLPFNRKLSLSLIIPLIPNPTNALSVSEPQLNTFKTEAPDLLGEGNAPLAIHLNPRLQKTQESGFSQIG
jgi:hypothetical protein